jgi:hypothetical protein
MNGWLVDIDGQTWGFRTVAQLLEKLGEVLHDE